MFAKNGDVFSEDSIEKDINWLHQSQGERTSQPSVPHDSWHNKIVQCSDN